MTTRKQLNLFEQQLDFADVGIALPARASIMPARCWCEATGAPCGPCERELLEAERTDLDGVPA